MKPINYKKFKKAELVHLLHDVIGDVKVMNHFKECYDYQLEREKVNGVHSCYKCTDIGKKLNVIQEIYLLFSEK